MDTSGYYQHQQTYEIFEIVAISDDGKQVELKSYSCNHKSSFWLNMATFEQDYRRI
ncbi:hypothetical protein [Moraxella sp.]|uniref:hypothetical protein n=1 Tax=Moraxella sp. TaxID=479 RepID=UPI0026DADC2D|nr:hypothetical protein [Moraxella sp.]MDO4895013.1 hypothetical protein [Moraxella sp.]